MKNILLFVLVGVVFIGLITTSSDPVILIGYALTFGLGLLLSKQSKAPAQKKTKRKVRITDTLTDLKKAAFNLFLHSGVINILALTGSFFMMEIYDRVLPSKSVPTLIGLAVIALFLYFCQGLLDAIRSRVMLRMGVSLNNSMHEKVYQTIIKSSGDHNQPIRDLDSVRSFLSGQGPIALLDMPWMPLYLGIIYAFHPLLGWTAIGGAVILVLLTVLTELRTGTSVKKSAEFAARRQIIIDSSFRNSEVLRSMGMLKRFTNLWKKTNDEYMSHHKQTTDVSSGIGAASKVIRMILQSAMLGLGALLVINGEASGGVIIAGSILTSRALAPVDLAISQWKGFSAARQAWKRLKTVIVEVDDKKKTLTLPAPSKSFVVDKITGTAPGANKFLVNNVSFNLRPGQVLGVVGASGSGKSSLARMIVGAWPLHYGKIRFDGAALEQWDQDLLGKHVGYLPQDVELFSGTIGENISRFEENANMIDILEAARMADVHELIVGMEDGYNTQIGTHGLNLSAGQQQRIALARALYKNPFLIVLDEPNSNLDVEGEAALSRAIVRAKQRGSIVIVISHRPAVLLAVDQLLVMNKGTVQQYGPRDDVLNLKAA